MKPLVGEASRLLSSLPCLKIRAAQVLDLRTAFWVLKIREEGELSISLGVTHKEPIPVELTFSENHPKYFVNWQLHGHLKVFVKKEPTCDQSYICLKIPPAMCDPLADLAPKLRFQFPQLVPRVSARVLTSEKKGFWFVCLAAGQ